MFYDLMSADGITGQYDNCLFSLHMPQKLGTRRKEDDKVKRLVSEIISFGLTTGRESGPNCVLRVGVPGSIPNRWVTH
jgi:hypothetical protein